MIMLELDQTLLYYKTACATLAHMRYIINNGLQNT